MQAALEEDVGVAAPAEISTSSSVLPIGEFERRASAPEEALEDSAVEEARAGPTGRPPPLIQSRAQLHKRSRLSAADL